MPGAGPGAPAADRAGRPSSDGLEVAVVSQPVLNQLNLAVRDMDATPAFSGRLGFVIDAPAGAEHVAMRQPAR